MLSPRASHPVAFSWLTLSSFPVSSDLDPSSSLSPYAPEIGEFSCAIVIGEAMNGPVRTSGEARDAF